MTTGRTYAGKSAQERVIHRRRQLLEAGLEVFGSTGYRRATVRQICREARVADRSFYEEFSGTEDLLIAVYDDCLDRLQRAVLGALIGVQGDVRVLAAAGLDALLACVEGDPRLARVVWFEVLGVSRRVEQKYMTRMAGFTDLLLVIVSQRDISTGLDGEDRKVVLTALVGGVSQVILNWVSNGFAPQRGELVRPLAAMLLSVARVRLDD